MLKNLDVLFNKRPYYLIDREEDLQMVVDAVENENVIGVDTENDSLFSYYPRMCLLQISSKSTDFLIDPLLIPDISTLAPIFSNEKIQKIFHDAKFDLHFLTKDHRFKIRNIYDTMLSAGWAGSQKLGLDSVVAEFLSVELNKSMQKMNWAIRPLDMAQIDYARRDSSILIPLKEATYRKIRSLDREKICNEEFEFLTLNREPSPYERRFHPKDYIHIPGARKLGKEKRRILQELYIFRENMSKKLNISPHKLLSNNDLLKLVGRKVNSKDDLYRIKRFSREFIEGIGDELIEAIQNGKKFNPNYLKEHRPRKNGDYQQEEFGDSPKAKESFLKIKKWRKEKAAQFGVKPDFIMSASLIAEIMRESPSTIDDLFKLQFMRKWQIEIFGSEIIDLLNGHCQEGVEEIENGN